MKKINWEAETIKLASEGTILDMIIIQIGAFQAVTYSRPELVVITNKLRPAMARELIMLMGLTPQEAVAEPIWLDGIPVVFSAKLGEHYIRVSHRGIQKELTI
jgi:hypothetical protein